MKKFKNIVIKGALITSILASSQMLYASSKAPQVTCHHEQINSNEVNVTLGVENLSDEVVALEVSIVADDIKRVILSNEQLEGVYATYQIIDVGNEKEKLICYIVSKDSKTPLELKGHKLTTLRLETSGKLTFNSEEVSVKIIEKDYKVTEYKQVDLAYTESEYNPSNDNESTGGSDNENNSGTSGGTSVGSNNGSGNSNISGTIKPEDKEEVVQKPTQPEQDEVVQVNFTDVENHWAKDAIINMAGKGIIKGYEDGSFKPSASITRGEFATLLARAFELENTGVNPGFKDVLEDKWYTDSISALYQLGITSGRPDGSFGVSERITNEEICTMLYRAINVLGLELEEVRTEAISFTDADQVSPYAKEGVLALTKLGIINGNPDGSFGAKASTSRAQVAVMLDRIFKMI